MHFIQTVEPSQLYFTNFVYQIESIVFSRCSFENTFLLRRDNVMAAFNEL